MWVSEKTTENFEWLGRQAGPGIDPGISHRFERRVSPPLVRPTKWEMECWSRIHSSILNLEWDYAFDFQIVKEASNLWKYFSQEY